MTENESSLERVLTDQEMILAAFPDEVDAVDQLERQFPIELQLRLDPDTYLRLQFNQGYPETSTITVSSQRTVSADKRSALEAAVNAVKSTAKECEGQECGMACCSAALEAFQENIAYKEQQDAIKPTSSQIESISRERTFCWKSGEPLVDRKSTFVAHICKIATEKDVQAALHELIDGNTKLQRATHNMYAWRVSEETPDGTIVEKHDNDDDGEHGAGSRLAQLLQMRNERNLLVVVSRWFGGTHLGPKRFALISNAAQQLLIREHQSS